MLVYFLLIGFASLFVSIEFIADTNSPELKQELLSNFSQYSQNEIAIADVFLPIEKIRNKAILMIVIIMLVMVIVLTMFTKTITEPLQHMIETAKKISGGDLRQSIEIHSNTELAELGNVINELSSNLQETTLLSKNVCQIGSESISSSLALLDQDDLDAKDREKIRQHLNILKKEMGSLEGFVNCFHFYTGKDDN